MFDLLPKVLTEKGKGGCLKMCRCAGWILWFRAVNPDSFVALRLWMPIHALISPWTRNSQPRPFRQLLLAIGLYQSLADGFGYGFRLGADVQFAIDRAQMHIDGVLGDGELIGDFLFDEALHEEAQHIFFT